jgi:hypothetical protein
LTEEGALENNVFMTPSAAVPFEEELYSGMYNNMYVQFGDDTGA